MLFLLLSRILGRSEADVLQSDTWLALTLFGYARHWPALDALGIFFAEYAIFLLVVWAYLLFRRRVVVVLLAILAALFGNMLAGIFLLADRMRPYTEFGIVPLVPLIADSNSFPSDHTAISFALATLIFFHHRAFGMLAYLVALTIGISRIFVGMHYPGDVIGGIAVGIAMMYIVRWFFKKKFPTFHFV